MQMTDGTFFFLSLKVINLSLEVAGTPPKLWLYGSWDYSPAVLGRTSGNICVVKEVGSAKVTQHLPEREELPEMYVCSPSYGESSVVLFAGIKCVLYYAKKAGEFLEMIRLHAEKSGIIHFIIGESIGWGKKGENYAFSTHNLQISLFTW